MDNNNEILAKITARIKELEKEAEAARQQGFATTEITDQIVDLQMVRETQILAGSSQPTPPTHADEMLFAAIDDGDEEEGEEEDLGDEEAATDASFKMKPDPGPGKADPNNTVAMSAKLRKQIGMQAADFLDEYGQEVHRRVAEFVSSIREKALDLGADGKETPLRTELREEVGVRGLRAIEPMFDEWRTGVAKQLAADIKEAFPTAEQEAQPTEVAEENIPALIGIDHMETEEVEIKKKKKKKGKKGKKNKKKVKSLDDDLRDAESSFLKEEKEKKEKEEADKKDPVEASIVVATTPIKMTISAAAEKAPSRTATDFMPSGQEPVVLE